jgi:hypothetical protein
MRPSLPPKNSESQRRQVKRDEYSNLMNCPAAVVSCKAAAHLRTGKCRTLTCHFELAKINLCRHRLSVYRRPTMYQSVNIPSETKTCTVRVSSPHVAHVLNARESNSGCMVNDTHSHVYVRTFKNHPEQRVFLRALGHQ